MNFIFDKWSPERVDRLVLLWSTGLTASQVGKRMGVSRNSIIGKISRLRSSGRNVERRRDPVYREKVIEEDTKAQLPPVRRILAATEVNDKGIYGAGIPIVREGVMGKEGRCKYGLWGIRDYPDLEDKLVCGQPAIPGKSWCRHCYRLVYSPVVKRERRRASP